MAKVQQKSEKITAFGGIFFVLDKFDSILSSVIEKPCESVPKKEIGGTRDRGDRSLISQNDQSPAPCNP